jgi:hypothetical protein
MVGLEQYTIHPFVYLPSVLRPPIAEYTSITDCIDTSNIDRPPSPPVSTSVSNKYNVFFSNPNSSSNPGVEQLVSQLSVSKPEHKSSLKEYCSNESARSIVARQESEILRLAEESQHVIISQLLNNLVKKGDETNKFRSSKMSKEDPSKSLVKIPFGFWFWSFICLKNEKK